jgi:phage shock protein PspC (stress-responsive transcriptional regulator)
MVHVNEWHNIWKSNNVGGAVTGLYLYSNFKHTLSRWLMMFSLSFTTIAIYLLIDTVFFLQNGDNKFKEWINKLSLKLYAFGTLGYWVIGAWYLFGATLPLLKPETISKNLYLLMGITALSPIIPLILILQKHQNITKSNTILIAAMQLIVIALNAISRQVIQNLQLLPFLDVTKEKVSPQINIMLIFLITFVTGIGIIVYMIKQIINVKGEQVN